MKNLSKKEKIMMIVLKIMIILIPILIGLCAFGLMYLIWSIIL